jgi:hypothetical protein
MEVAGLEKTLPATFRQEAPVFRTSQQTDAGDDIPIWGDSDEII